MTAVLLVVATPSLAAQPSTSPAPPTAGSTSARAAPTVASVEVQGLDLLDPPVRLPGPLALRPGVSYTDERRDATRQAVARAFAERGHPYAMVEIRTRPAESERAGTRPPDVGVTIRVTSAGPTVRFGAVQVEAIPPLRAPLARERLAYAPGDLFSPSAIEVTQERILELPAVDRAVVIPFGLDRGDTLIATVVSVAPVSRPRGPELEGTLSSARCLSIAGFWRDRLFLGEPRVFGIGAGGSQLFARQLGGRFPCTGAGQGPEAEPGYFVQAELAAPWPGEPRTTVGGRAFFRREVVPQVHATRGFGGEVDARHRVRRDLQLGVSYSMERTEVRAADAYFCAAFGACAAADLEAVTGPRRLAPLTAHLLWIPLSTQRGLAAEPRPGPPPDVLAPRWRPRAAVSVAVAAGATGSSHRYVRGSLEGALARTLGDRSEVAVRARVGGILAPDEAVPPMLRFFSGGVSSVRGVPENLLGARILVTDLADAERLGCEPAPDGCPPGTVVNPDLVRVRPQGGDLVYEANLEGRFRAHRRVQLAAFLDLGVIGGDPPVLERTGVGAGGSASTGGRTWTSRATPGVGIRVRSPVGFLRLDVGYGPRDRFALPLLTSAPDDRSLIHLGEVIWDPAGWDGAGSTRRFLRRLQLGLGVGQPF
jgi:hypothetical protein